jgi:putative FmdB family regulatory protein
MPIYDYLCTACDHRADILHGINDPGPNFCPSCGAEKTMRKQFAAPAVHFKGSGWAKKDRGGSSSTKASAKAASGGSSDSSDSSEGKPADSSSSAGSDTTPKPSTTD